MLRTQFPTNLGVFSGYDIQNLLASEQRKGVSVIGIFFFFGFGQSQGHPLQCLGEVCMMRVLLRRMSGSYRVRMHPFTRVWQTYGLLSFFGLPRLHVTAQGPLPSLPTWH